MILYRSAFVRFTFPTSLSRLHQSFRHQKLVCVPASNTTTSSQEPQFSHQLECVSSRSRHSSKENANNTKKSTKFGLFAFSFFGIMGWEDWKKLDDDPLKDKVKWAMLHRGRGNYDEAINVLHEALSEAERLKNPKYITRIYDELANTYYEAEDWERADQMFRLVVHRLITLHRKTEISPEFIGISLKLADIFAHRGDPESADIGYKHCLSKQVKEVEKAMGKYHISHGAHIESNRSMADEPNLGLDYLEPFALLGLCLHEYALFLVDFYPDSRLDEAQEYINEALRVSNRIYGFSSFHALNIISTFATKCVVKNKFEVARKYLEIGLGRLLQSPECESVSEQDIIVAYYTAYAESLFHTGEFEKAMDFAQRAADFARKHPDSAVRSQTKDFAKQLTRDGRREQRRAESGEQASGWWPWRQ